MVRHQEAVDAVLPVPHVAVGQSHRDSRPQAEENEVEEEAGEETLLGEQERDHAGETEDACGGAGV